MGKTQITNIIERNGKKVKEPTIKVLGMDFYEPEYQEGLKEILTSEQIRVAEKLFKGELEKEERWVAYIQGFNLSEIAESEGTSRENVRARVQYQLGNNYEKGKEQYEQNRDSVIYARKWTLYVYLADKYNDYEYSKEVLQGTKYDRQPTSLGEDYMYNLYKRYGGTKQKSKYPDKREVLDYEKRERIKEKLEVEPIEQVAFQERVLIGSILDEIKKSGGSYFHEQPDGEYKEKYEKWLNVKRR